MFWNQKCLNDLNGIVVRRLEGSITMDAALCLSIMQLATAFIIASSVLMPIWIRLLLAVITLWSVIRTVLLIKGIESKKNKTKQMLAYMFQSFSFLLTVFTLMRYAKIVLK